MSVSIHVPASPGSEARVVEACYMADPEDSFCPKRGILCEFDDGTMKWFYTDDDVLVDELMGVAYWDIRSTILKIGRERSRRRDFHAMNSWRCQCPSCLRGRGH